MNKAHWLFFLDEFASGEDANSEFAKDYIVSMTFKLRPYTLLAIIRANRKKKKYEAKAVQSKIDYYESLGNIFWKCHVASSARDLMDCLIKDSQKVLVSVFNDVLVETK